MKIGILQCDDVADALVSEHGNYPAMVERLLREVDPVLEFETWACHRGELPRADAGVDAWVLTGSKHGANDDTPWIHALSDFINALWRRQQPLVGICFGHQLMAKALGGRVQKSEHGWSVGVSVNTIDVCQPWMTPWQGDTLHLLDSHQDQVVQLPENGVVLAHNVSCPIYMMQLGDVFLGVQGHPEFTAAYASDLMERQRAIVSERRIEAGLHSLSLQIDNLLVARWLLNFLQRAHSAAHQ